MKCLTCKEETSYWGNCFRPFCSEHCKLIDLGKWAAEEYRVSPTEGQLEEVYKSDENTEEDRESFNV